ncbi:MAG: DUF1566 domain-containing protein [Ottowia sp.]|uniref:Lcl C-terminal domain-containing protein n=1 Tax=Ottowia sp. TaxID=1898956 RepID=UPI0039E66FFF
MKPIPHLAALALMLVLSTAHAQLNDTGQTACTDSAGAAIACADPGDHSGQDGRFGRDAQAGGAAFSFSSLDGGCLQDGITGLIWSGETLTGPWASFSGLAYDRCGIATGWRLPTRRELLSIVHHGASQPASAFPGTQSAPYWSSDTQGGNAWAVDFADGDTKQIDQAETHAARLVVRPANQPPTITLGANIVVPQGDKPGPRTYPAWATGISPGPAREAGQHLTATVELLPLQPGDPKALEFETPPAIDPATGDLTFTLKHRIANYDAQARPTHDYWVSSAGLARLRVTLQDDGGTAGGGHDSTSADFTVFLDPVPSVFSPNIKHAWKPACVPFTMLAMDPDTDWVIPDDWYHGAPWWPYPTFKFLTYPSQGFITDYVSFRTPDGDEAIRFASARGSFDYVLPKTGMVKVGTQAASAQAAVKAVVQDPLPGIQAVMEPRPAHITWIDEDTPGLSFNFAMTWCYVPFSSTFTGSDTFTYQVTDPDGNVSQPGVVSIEIFELK